MNEFPVRKWNMKESGSWTTNVAFPFVISGRMNQILPFPSAVLTRDDSLRCISADFSSRAKRIRKSLFFFRTPVEAIAQRGSNSSVGSNTPRVTLQTWRVRGAISLCEGICMRTHKNDIAPRTRVETAQLCGRLGSWHFPSSKNPKGASIPDRARSGDPLDSPPERESFPEKDVRHHRRDMRDFERVKVKKKRLFGIWSCVVTLFHTRQSPANMPQRV